MTVRGKIEDNKTDNRKSRPGRASDKDLELTMRIINESEKTRKSLNRVMSITSLSKDKKKKLERMNSYQISAFEVRKRFDSEINQETEFIIINIPFFYLIFDNFYINIKITYCNLDYDVERNENMMVKNIIIF